MNKKKLQQAIESQTKTKSKITWRQVSDPLGKGNGSTHPRQNKAQAKSANHRIKAQTTTKSSPCTHASSPLTNATPPWTNACKPLENRAAATTSANTGQTGHHHRSDRCQTCAQDQHSDRSDRWPRPVKPVHNWAQKWFETAWKPSKCIQQAISSSNFSPLLAMHESSQKCTTFNLELLK
jgi:hypothetical protein